MGFFVCATLVFLAAVWAFYRLGKKYFLLRQQESQRLFELMSEFKNSKHDDDNLDDYDLGNDDDIYDNGYSCGYQFAVDTYEGDYDSGFAAGYFEGHLEGKYSEYLDSFTRVRSGDNIGIAFDDEGMERDTR